MSHDSSVGIWTVYRLDDLEVGVRVQKWQCSLLHIVRTASGVHPNSYPVGNGGGGALSFLVKRQGREADNSPPTNAEVNKTRIYISTP
jgi:hypothetical protein